MAIHPPHSPIHEATEFWYDTKTKALLYEVLIDPQLGRASADHRRFRGTTYAGLPFALQHNHSDPHGINLKDSTVGEHRTKVSVRKTELIIRLWCQIENDEQPKTLPYGDPPLLPVPKTLALFLAEKQADMYKEESFTQSLALLQTYLTAKAISRCPSPT